MSQGWLATARPPAGAVGHDLTTYKGVAAVAKGAPAKGRLAAAEAPFQGQLASSHPRAQPLVPQGPQGHLVAGCPQGATACGQSTRGSGQGCRQQGQWRRLEIVYLCIPYPDGEDEGGQASSSLAVSTRWISAAKLLQSDIATLAQREGGE
ncbi:hypothetical protein GW17_00012406 [Ensete ventricosum]|nr:hypothetical protein GW17_00012406 [Ensete ventricosum]